MKTRLQVLFYSILCFLLLSGSAGWAQGLAYSSERSSTRGIEIGAQYGHQFWGKLSTVRADINIKASAAWNFTLDIQGPVGMQIELLYNRQDTFVEAKEIVTGIRTKLFDVGVNYFQVGVLRGLPQGNILPYGVFTMGATYFDPKDRTYSDEWRFSITFGLGLKYYASERVGVRLGANLLLPITWGGGGIFCGTGGCSTGITAGSSIVQGNVMGGLFLVI